MSRSQVQSFKSPQNPLGSNTWVFNSFTLASGSGQSYVLWVAGSWEGGFGDPPSLVADTINGTPSGKTWQIFYYGATREAWIAYCFDHPGGTNIVVTATVANGNSRAYGEGYGGALTGQAGEPDPRTLAAVTATSTNGNLSFPFTRTGDGTLVASCTSVASLPGFTPTSPAVLVDTLSTPANYGGAMMQAVTGSGPTQTIASTGGQNTYLMNGIALAFNDPPSGGGGSKVPIKLQLLMGA